MSIIRVCFALIVTALATLPAARASQQTTVLQQVHIVDVAEQQILRDRQVLVEGDRITGIYQSDWQAPNDARVINGRGGYLLPGLTEMHAHVPGSNASAQYLDDTLLLYLANGITRIRGMLGEPMHLTLREALAQGTRVGPLLITSGPSLNGNSVQNSAQAVEMVNAQADAGYDFLKIHPGIASEPFRALVLTAKQRGLAMAGHVPEAVGLERALQVPMASIDHFDGYAQWLTEASDAQRFDEEGFFAYRVAPGITETAIQQVVELTSRAGVAQVPTDSLMHHALLLDPDISLQQRPELRYAPKPVLERWRASARAIQSSEGHAREQALAYMRIRHALIQQMQKAGVPILLGSDAPQIFNVPGFSIHHEIELMQQAGLSPKEILASATLAPATFFGLQDSAGRIGKGFEANLVLLRANPLEDLEHLKAPLGVMVGGRWHSRETLDKALADIARRNGYEE
jgi:imidazolonepropionase-like amidohydrolase